MVENCTYKTLLVCNVLLDRSSPFFREVVLPAPLFTAFLAPPIVLSPLTVGNNHRISLESLHSPRGILEMATQTFTYPNFSPSATASPSDEMHPLHVSLISCEHSIHPLTPWKCPVRLYFRSFPLSLTSTTALGDSSSTWSVESCLRLSYISAGSKCNTVLSSRAPF
jgi:hypothetical protein